MKLQKYLYPTVNTVIRALLVVIVTGICLQSLFSTSFIGYITREDGSRQEKTLNIADQPWRHLLLLAVFVTVCLIGYRIFRRFVKNGLQAAKAFRILSVVTFLGGMVWVLVTQMEPGSDPSKIYRVAMQWRMKDFSAYAEGGYLFRYPFQAGIVLFYYLLSFLFGIDNYVGAQFVNVIALTVIYLMLAKLAVLFWRDDKAAPVMAYAALILWPPLSLYVTYLYGILPGMALSLCAVYCAAKYLDTGRYRYILPAVLCMGAATVLKMNCLIYLIAISCFLIYDAVEILASGRKESGKRWLVSISFVLLLILGVVGCGRACDRYVERLSGYRAPDGEAMLSWVVMGLSDAPFGPGSYNGYIGDVFTQYDYDTDRINEASAQEIRKILTRMSDNILGEGYLFFARKNAFQWNDPTFISLECTRGRNSVIDVPESVRSLIDGRGSVKFYIVMNYAQTLILFGALFYLALNWKSRNIRELIGAVIFLGGYLFHFIWESGASYTLPYFAILVPYAVKGFADLVRRMDGALSALSESGDRGQYLLGMLRKTGKPMAGILLFALLVALCSHRNLFRDSIALDDGEEAAWQFYHRGETEPDGSVSEMLAQLQRRNGGYCYLVPKLAPDTALAAADGAVTLAPVPPDAASSSEERRMLADMEGIDGMVAVRKSGNGVLIRFRSNEQVLAVDRESENPWLVTYLDDDMNMFYEEKNVSCAWEISPAEEGGWYITLDGLALTCHDGRVALEDLAQSGEQVWLLR